MFEKPQYYLAAQADEIYVDPLGLVPGRRVRVVPHVLQGRCWTSSPSTSTCSASAQYKSAVEPYSRTDMSPDAKEETSVLPALALVPRTRTSMCEGSQAEAGGRSARTPRRSRIRSRDVEGHAAEVALKAGLVTGIKSAARGRRDLVKKIVGEDEQDGGFKGVSVHDYIRVVRGGEGLAWMARAEDRGGRRVRRDSRWRPAAGDDRWRIDRARCCVRRAWMTT